jgi:SagB-type dehydrogenase family enzyme
VPAADRSRGRRLRRIRSLVLYLDGQRLVGEDYLAHRRFELNLDALHLLGELGRWTTRAEAAARFPGYDPASVDRSLDLLVRKRLLVYEGTDAARVQESLRGWSAWDPAATYFHYATRKTRFAITPAEVKATVARVTRTPMPSIYKDDPPGPRVRLPDPSPRLAPGSLGRALVARRTCREFRADRPLARRALEAVTVLTFGRLGLIDGGPFGTLLHRASPSGGGRHPVECYVMALNVAGLKRGLYHYSVRENALVRVGDEASSDLLMDFTCGQEWFQDAAAVFLLTAVYARSQWKYRTPRAYRVILLDTAHATQTLLLTATSLGLGAFAIAAIDEEAIDRYLGVNGVTEGSLYLAGIGVPDRARYRRAVGRDGLRPGGPAPERPSVRELLPARRRPTRAR